MLRILLIAAVILLILYLFRAVGRPSSDEVRSNPREAVPRMVRCAYCGVHVPEDEAWPEGDHHYCSGDHRNRGPRSDD